MARQMAIVSRSCSRRAVCVPCASAAAIPTGRMAESPAPTPRIARPSATSSRLRAAQAVARGWRLIALVTATPNCTREVVAAQAPRVTYGSISWPARNGESRVHTWLKPLASAARAARATSPMDSHCGMRMPKQTPIAVPRIAIDARESTDRALTSLPYWSPWPRAATTRTARRTAHDPVQSTQDRRAHDRGGCRHPALGLDHHRAANQGARAAARHLLRGAAGHRAERVDERGGAGAALVRHRAGRRGHRPRLHVLRDREHRAPRGREAGDGGYPRRLHDRSPGGGPGHHAADEVHHPGGHRRPARRREGGGAR